MRVSFFCVAVIAAMICPASTAQADLIAHWAMDDSATNNVITDSSGNGNHGVMGVGTIAAMLPVNTDTRSAAGVFGNCLDLSGDVFVDLTSHIAALKPVDDYTLAMWVGNPGDVLSDGLAHTVFAWGVDDPYHPRIQFDLGKMVDLNQIGYFYSDAVDGGGYASRGTVSWVPEGWHHVAVTVEREDANTIWCTLYQDGTEILKTDLMSKMYSFWGDGPDTIGVQTGAMHTVLNQVTLGGVDYGSLDSGQYSNLPLDDVGLWDNALSQTEIQDVMNNGINPVPEPNSLVLLIGILTLLLFRRHR